MGISHAAAQVEGFAFGQWIVEQYGPRVPAHGHAEAHFIFALSGDYFSEAEGPSSRSRLVCSPPQTYHRDHFETRGSFFSVTVGADAWETLADHGAPRRPICADGIAARAAIHRLLRRVVARDVSNLSCEGHCMDLVGAVLSRPIRERTRPSWLDAACDLIRDCAADTLSLTAVSRATGVHPSHLTRTFRSFENCTPGEYLDVVRLDRAAALLTAGRLSLAEIAVACGYSDQSHFTRGFRRAYGFPPGRYRQLTCGIKSYQ